MFDFFWNSKDFSANFVGFQSARVKIWARVFKGNCFFFLFSLKVLKVVLCYPQFRLNCSNASSPRNPPYLYPLFCYTRFPSISNVTHQLRQYSPLASVSSPSPVVFRLPTAECGLLTCFPGKLKPRFSSVKFQSSQSFFHITISVISDC